MPASRQYIKTSDLDPGVFACGPAGLTVDWTQIPCDVVNQCVNQGQVSISASGDPEATNIYNSYVPDPDCLTPGPAIVTQTIKSPDGLTTYSTGPVPVNSSQVFDFTVAPYAPERTFLVETVVVDSCGTTADYTLITINATTIGDATIGTAFAGPADATEVSTTYVPHPDCVDPGAPVATREIWNAAYTTLLQGPDPVTLGGTDVIDFSVFAPAVDFVICTNVVDNCGVTNNCELLTINKDIPVEDALGNPIACTGVEAADLAAWEYNGVTYTTYSSLAAAIVVNEPTVTQASVFCDGGVLKALVNGDATPTEIVLVDAYDVLPINSAPGGPAIACTGVEATDLAGYTFQDQVYTTYNALAAAIIASDPTIVSAVVACVGGFLQVTVNNGATPTEIVMPANAALPLLDESAAPIACTGVEADDLEPYVYKGIAYTTYAGLAAAIVDNEPTITIATVECVGGFLQVVVNGTAAPASITLDDALLPPVAGVIFAGGQASNESVEFELTYSNDVDCGPQTPVSSYRIVDGNGVEVVGPTPAIAGTVSLDFEPLINGGDVFNANYPLDFTFTVFYTAVDACGVSVEAGTTAVLDPRLTNFFAYTGIAESVPSPPVWANQVQTKVWGAGGGGAANPTFPASSIAGAGGYSEDTFAVGALASYVIIVGEGGQFDVGTTTFGGGGAAATGHGSPGAPPGISGSQGGGLSGLFDISQPIGATAPWALPLGIGQGNALLIAGGGGGNGVGGVGNYGIGGAGGGLVGENASWVTNNPAQYPASNLDAGRGLAGSQVAGGASRNGRGNYSAPSLAGSALLGSRGGLEAPGHDHNAGAFHGSGGGGGGYWGGSGGSTVLRAGAGVADQTGYVADQGGGGGSGYAPTGTTTASAGKFPVNTADPQYQEATTFPEYAVQLPGEGGSPGEFGGDGLVVLNWTL